MLMSHVVPVNPKLAADETEAQTASKPKVQVLSLIWEHLAHRSQKGTGLGFWRPGFAARAVGL